MSELDNLRIQHIHNQNKLNSLDTPANQSSDKNLNTRLRLAIIDNYLKDRNGELIDPLDTKNIINMSTGMITIKYVDLAGGEQLPESFGYPAEGYTTDWKYIPENDSQYPEERTLDCYTDGNASDKEIIPLTHTFIWSNGNNWCGMNFLPPVGTIVIVGYSKNNEPHLLGCVQSSYSSCKPYLKVGETMIKGYGNNYTHWRWSNKLDNHVWSEKGTIDLDDPEKKDQYDKDLDIWVRYNTKLEHLLIQVIESIDDMPAIINNVEINQQFLNVSIQDLINNKNSKLLISTDDFNIIQNNNDEIQSFEINDTGIHFNSDKGIYFNNNILNNNTKLNKTNNIIECDIINGQIKTIFPVGFNKDNCYIKTLLYIQNDNMIQNNNFNAILNDNIIINIDNDFCVNNNIKKVKIILDRY